MPMNIPELPTGIRNKVEMTVNEEHTANHLLSGMLDVYATPSLIAFMEYVAFTSLNPYLPENLGTVGTLVNIKHLSATPVGMRVTCESELIEVDGRRLVFSVTASDECGVIGEGIHERMIIDNARFMEKLRNKTKTDKE